MTYIFIARIDSDCSWNIHQRMRRAVKRIDRRSNRRTVHGIKQMMLYFKVAEAELNKETINE